MAASFSDMFQLSQDTTFQNRVQASLFSTCVAVANEGWAKAFHRERATFCVQILTFTGTGTNPYVILFANAVATDTNCIADATAAGTVVLTPANRAAQAALVTDAHINSAISSQFDSFIREPAG